MWTPVHYVTLNPRLSGGRQHNRFLMLPSLGRNQSSKGIIESRRDAARGDGYLSDTPQQAITLCVRVCVRVCLRVCVCVFPTKDVIIITKYGAKPFQNF